MRSKCISHIEILFEQNERAFFEKVLLEYLFDISNKVEDFYIFENFTLASKSQLFLYLVFHQPAPGYKKPFYICRRSDEKYKYSFLVTLFRLGFF